MDEAIAQRCIAEARYMLRHRTTIRQTAAAFQLSKSGIHKDMLQHLPQADAALAREVSALLAYNKSVRHLRGGDPRACMLTVVPLRHCWGYHTARIRRCLKKCPLKSR